MDKPEIKQNPGTGLYKHVLTVTILSDSTDSDVDNYSLADIAEKGFGEGGTIVVEYEMGCGQELTKPEMAQALREAGSEPGFLLGDDGWKYEMTYDDEITVGDYTGKIRQITWNADGTQAAIAFQDGTLLSCSAEEIS